MSLKFGKTKLSFKEAIGPFRTYYLSRALTLDFQEADVIVRGGAASHVTLRTRSEPDDSSILLPRVAADTFKQVECEIGVKLVGSTGQDSGEILFWVDQWVVSGRALAEELLGKVTVLESVLFGVVLSSCGFQKEELRAAQEKCAVLHSLISDGRLGPAELSNFIDESHKVGAQAAIEAAFFLLNAEIIAEDMRTSLLAACQHFVNMTASLRGINSSGVVPSESNQESEQPWEVIHRSPEADNVAFCYASSVTACYTSLDLLYQYFVFLTRVPLLNPDFPKNLHFPDAPESKVFQGGGTALPEDLDGTKLPFAIPNLQKGQFAALRKNRNDLVHNMAADAIRPRVYVGSGFKPVNSHPLQYVQYLARDIDTNGDPVSHPWNRRFYMAHSDAQEILLDWLEQTWQCVFDTTEWLTHRLNRLTK